MKNSQDRLDSLQNLFYSNNIASIDDIMAAINSNSRMTAYRVLSKLGYLTSYSHRGRFYTLPQIPIFDEYGRWSFRSVWFSQFGNLLDTVAALVQRSDEGFTASELDRLLQVESQKALLNLWRRKKISRSKQAGHLVYMSTDPGERRRQELMRQERTVRRELALGLEAELLPDELKAGIILFFSLLDEKQRRLYAGGSGQKLTTFAWCGEKCGLKHLPAFRSRNKSDPTGLLSTIPEQRIDKIHHILG